MLLFIPLHTSTWCHYRPHLLDKDEDKRGSIGARLLLGMLFHHKSLTFCRLRVLCLNHHVLLLKVLSNFCPRLSCSSFIILVASGRIHCVYLMVIRHLSNSLRSPRLLKSSNSFYLGGFYEKLGLIDLEIFLNSLTVLLIPK